MRWRLFLLLGTTALLGPLILMQYGSNAHAQSTVIWSANHEKVSQENWYSPNDDNYGGGEVNSGCADTQPAYGFGRNPSGADPLPFSLILTMAAPCGLIAESGARMFRWLEPSQHPDLYYKVWYYFPEVFSLTHAVSPWWTIMSWKSTATNPSRNDPFFSIGIANRQNGNMYLWVREAKPYDPANARSLVQDLADVPVNQWFYIEAYYKSRGDATGQVTIWQGDDTNRFLLWDLQGVQTRFPDGEGGTTQWAVTSISNGTSPYMARFAIDDAEIRTP